MAKETIHSVEDAVTYSFTQLAYSADVLGKFSGAVWREVGPPVKYLASREAGKAVERVIYTIHKAGYSPRTKPPSLFNDMSNNA